MTKFRKLFLSVLVLLGGSVFTVSPAWSVAPPSPAQPVPDVSLPDTVQLSPAQMGAHWVKTEVVRTRKLVRTINRTGSLNFDEEMVSVLAARVSGREVKILAFEGQKVRRNDALALVYSPDFVTAEVEYLNAFKVASTFQDKSETETYIRAAAKKLILLGASDRDLKTLSTTRKIFPYLTIHAPRSGVILNSQLREGLFMNPGDQLLTIADLSKLWVYMDIYEGDLPLVRTGQKIDVRTVAYPDRVFAGRIIYQGGNGRSRNPYIPCSRGNRQSQPFVEARNVRVGRYPSDPPETGGGFARGLLSERRQGVSRFYRGLEGRFPCPSRSGRSGRGRPSDGGRGCFSGGDSRRIGIPSCGRSSGADPEPS
ncbi:MAG: efflux RND transporter periplasmic adaptor subunit [Leptospirales bacterium]